MKFNTKLVKNVFSGVFVFVLIFWLFQIDWNNLVNKNNSGAIFGVLASVMIIVSLQLKEKVEKDH